METNGRHCGHPLVVIRHGTCLECEEVRLQLKNDIYLRALLDIIRPVPDSADGDVFLRVRTRIEMLDIAKGALETASEL